MNLEQARFNMVEQQVRPWHVLDDTVLNTMQSIPRDLFAPDDKASLAYADIEIPLNNSQSMMFPRVEGRMLQELELGIEDICLEVGTGSGFVTACIATMAKHVDSIDIYDDFLASASESLAKMNISNVSLENKDAISSFSNPDYFSHKKYDAIAVTGSLPEYIPLFEKLLKPNGRLFVVIGTKQTMHAMKITRNDDGFERTSLFETELTPLVGVDKKSTFSF